MDCDVAIIRSFPRTAPPILSQFVSATLHAVSSQWGQENPRSQPSLRRASQPAARLFSGIQWLLDFAVFAQMSKPKLFYVYVLMINLPWMAIMYSCPPKT